MQKGTNKQEALYNFLFKCYLSKQSFSVDEAVEATGYEPSTIATYIRKKLLHHLVEVNKNLKSYYVINEIEQYENFYQFVEHMSQTSRKVKDQHDQFH